MNPPPQRSTFVTVVAWLSIILSGFSLLATMAGGLLLVAFLGSGAVDDIMAEFPPELADVVPLDIIGIVVGVLLFLGFIWWLVALGSSIGLLCRKNWARITFLCLLVLGLIWNIGGFLLQLIGIAVMMFAESDEIYAYAAGPDMFTIAMFAVNALLTLVTAAFSIWVLKRLMSRDIVAEFVQKPRQPHTDDAPVSEIGYAGSPPASSSHLPTEPGND